MKELGECIKSNTVGNTQEVQKCIASMICTDNDPLKLTQKSLLEALELEGEFLVLNLHYDNFEEELKSAKIKYKISQSLSVLVRYEDDGSAYEKITDFVKYIYDISDEKQTSSFGVKKVDKLSEFPITILFSGILPINQLKMTVGKAIDTFIHEDNSYFVPRFEKHRDDISKEVGIPILPVFPLLDSELKPYTVRLVDLHDGRLISEFEVDENISKETMEIYLLKLFYIYKVLVEEKQKFA